MGPPNFPTHWDILLSAWIIHDGNYRDFEVGQTAEFALEFRIHEGATPEISNKSISAHWFKDFLYDSVADVVLKTEEITVLDIGILIYQETSSSTQSLSSKSRVAVRLSLAVDPFFYFERLSKIAEVPPLVYTWRLTSIRRLTAAFTDKVADGDLLAGEAVRVVDLERLSYDDVLKTNALEDDDGHAEYLLRCDLLPVPPKRESATSLALKMRDPSDPL